MNINENKLYELNIREYIDYINNFKNNTWIWFDTETTGLSPKDAQITQIAAIATDYNYNEIDVYNKKANLTPEIKNKMHGERDIDNDPKNKQWTVKKSLSLNKYGSGGEYIKEDLLLNEFSNWVNSHNNPILVAYNNTFDMKMINTRTNSKLTQKNLDIMKMVQLFWIPMHEKLAEEGNEESKKILNTLGSSARSGLVGSRLGSVAKVLGVDTSQWHDALADIKMTIGVFKKIFSNLNHNYLIEINKHKGRRINQYRYNDMKRKTNR